MKRLIPLLIILLSWFGSYAQSPTSPVQSPTNSTWYEPSTKNIWGYLGSTYGWRQWVDSVQLKRDLLAYQLKLTGTGVLTFSGTTPTYYSLLPISFGGTGTATPSLIQGTGITVTGTWPNQTITYSGASGGVASFNSRTGSVVPLTGDYASFYYPLGSNPANYLTTTGNGSGLTGFTSSQITTALTFTPENAANKATTFGVLNNILYPSTSAVANYITALGYEVTANKVTTLDNSATHYPSTSAVTTALNPYLLSATATSTYQLIGTYLTPSSTNVVTNKDLTGAGNTFPTFNQNTTGSAAKLTTPRNINGVPFDGTASITIPSNTANSLTNGFGINTFTFNGSAATTVIVDTTTVKSKAGFLTDYNNLSGRITTNTNNISTNTSNIATLQGQHTSDYAAIGLKQPRIVGNKPAATGTTYAITDSVTQVLANLNSAVITNTTAIAGKQNTLIAGTNITIVGSTINASGGGGSSLAPTAVKTANYTAAAQDLVPVNTTSGNIVITLPTAPTDKTQVAVKMVIQGGTNTVTLNTAGADVFNKTGGATALTLNLLNQAVLLQYSTTGAIWYVVSDDLTLPSLDTRYNGISSSLYGTIYASNTWTAGTLAANFANSGITVTGNKLVFASGSLTYNYTTGLQRWKQSARVIIGVKNATPSLIKMGLQSGESATTNLNYCSFDYSTGANSGLVSITGGPSSTSATALTFSAGDTVLLTLERNQDLLTATAINITSKTSSVSTNVTYTAIGTAQIPNSSQWSVITTSANSITLDSLGMSSNETKNANLLILGTSKSNGAYASYLPTTFPRKLANVYGNTVISAGGYDKSQDYLNKIPEILALAPKQVLIEPSVNDLIQSVPAATWKANTASVVSQLQAAGIKVYLLDGIYDTYATGNSAPLYTWVHATYPSSMVINSYINGKNTPNSLNGDNIHPTQIGHDVVYQSVLDSRLIQYGNYAYSPNVYANYGYLRDSLRIGNYGTINANGITFPGSQSTGVTSPTFIDLGSSYTTGSGVAANVKFKIWNNGSGLISGIGFSGAYGQEYHSYNGSQHTFFLNNTQVAAIGSTFATFNGGVVNVNSGGTNYGILNQNIIWGQGGVGSTTPTYLNLGSSYSTTTGLASAMKVQVYNSGSGSLAGLGFSVAGGLEHHSYTTGHTFFIAGIQTAQLTTAGLKLNSIQAGTAGTDSVLVESAGVIKRISATYYGTGGGGGTGANPTATAGTSFVNGVATTFMRSDAAPKVDSTVFTTKALISTYQTKAQNIAAYYPLSGNPSSFLTANQSISFAPTGDVTGSTTGTTTLAPALSIGTGKVLNAMIANATIDPTTKLSTTGTPSATTYLRGDNTWATVSGGSTTFANPTGLVGMTAVNGVATTAERSDATHAIDPAIIPTWTGLHTFNPTLSATSGTDYGIKFTPTINQTSGTGGYTGIFENITQTAAGSGNKLLMDLQLGGTSKFKVDNTGALTAQGIITGNAQLNITSYGIINSIFINNGTGEGMESGGTNAIGFRTNGTQNRLVIGSAGHITIGSATDGNSWLYLPAGTTTVAPLRLVSGTNLTTPLDGAIEYNGTHYYGTIGSTRYQLDQQGGLSNPMTTLGDLIVGGTAGSATRLAGQTTITTKGFLTQTETSGVANTPVWTDLFGGANTFTNSNIFSSTVTVTGQLGLSLGGYANQTMLYTANDGTNAYVSQAAGMKYASTNGGSLSMGNAAINSSSSFVAFLSTANLGIQLPFMTTTQRLALPLTGVVTGLTAYDATLDKLFIANSSSAWKQILNTDDINGTQTSVSGSTSGSAKFNQVFQQANFKRVVIYCSALVGTASYTFPTAFVNTPAIVTTNGPASSTVTTISTTAVTLTSAGTGIIILEGY